MRLSTGLAVKNGLALTCLVPKQLVFIFLFGITFSSSINASGQGTADIAKFMPRPVPASPNVSGLGKYGTYEVNMYNGLPDISIPIFEAKSGSLSVPITLSYHASGVRMTDVASWVGLGWSLSAGGQISRSTKGRPDEAEYYANYPRYDNPSICTHFSYLKGTAENGIDTEPDVFSYSFPGGGGKFLLNQKGIFNSDASKKYLLIPYEPITITPDFGTMVFNKFDIRNEHGVLYRYGKNSAGVSAFEVSQNGNNGVDHEVTTAWQLMEIIAPNSDDKISFSYQSTGSAIMDDVSSAISAVHDHTEDGTGIPPQIFGTQSINHSTSAAQLGLSEILFDGGKVTFLIADRTDQATLKRLDAIEVYSELNGVYALTKKIQFVYSYYTGSIKLKLDEVQIRNASDEIQNRYKFTYYTNSFSWTFSHPYNLQRDWWGFYNGASNTDLIPHQEITLLHTSGPLNYWIGGATNRETNPQYLTEGVLKSIAYPTGGLTEFIYETHKYLENSVAKYAGGLRIASIKSYDGVSSIPIEKTYKYGTGESGYGIKNFKNESYLYSSETQSRDGGTSIIKSSMISFFSSSTLDIDANDGSPVVYPVVTEYHGNATSNIGKIIYEFDNGAYSEPDLFYFLPNSASTMLRRNSMNWKRGKLTKKTTYDNAGNPLAVSITSYGTLQGRTVPVGIMSQRYRTYNSGDLTTMGCDCCVSEFGDNIDVYEIIYQPYSQATGALRPVLQQETIYENGDINKAFTTTSTLTYDSDYLQLTSEDKVDRISTERTIKKTRYPFNFSTTGLTLTGNGRGLQMLNEKNMVSAPVEQYVIKHAADNTEQVIGGTLTTFLPNSANSQQVQADQIFVWESTPLALSSYSVSTLSPSSTIVPDARYKGRAKLKAFDANGNVLQVSKTNDIDVSYLYGYHRALPIAEVQNSDNDEQPDAETNHTYDYGSSFSSNILSDIAFSPTFTIDHTQTVSLAILFVKGTSGTPTTQPTLDVVLKKSNGTVAYDPGMIASYGTSNYSLTLAPDTYTFYYQGTANGDANNYASMIFKFTFNYQTQLTHHSKLFHTSFEEDGTTDANAKTGVKVHAGTYSVPIPDATGSYVITWWERTGTGLWSLMKHPVSGGGGSYSIGSSSGAVDEVRVHPANAQMKTYTYDPLFGITTSTDANNVTTYYGYDPLGRLKWIKDHEGNVLQSYEYHYQNESKPVE
jgi:YD repeat-containing protein